MGQLLLLAVLVAIVAIFLAGVSMKEETMVLLLVITCVAVFP